MFDLIDKNGTGRVDAEELLEFIKDLHGGERSNEEDIDQLFR